MIKDIKSYVNFDISQYICELENIVPSELAFTFHQTLEYILPSIFLKMTGCLEHKIDMISLQLAMNDEKYKQNILRKESQIPGKSKFVTEVLKSLYEQAHGEKITEEKIWSNVTIFDKTVSLFLQIVDSSEVCDYLGQSYQTLVRISGYKNNKVDEIVHRGFTHKLCYCEKGKSPLYICKLIYDKAIQYRNTFAHNENSVYIEDVTPSQLSNEDSILNNWCFRFVALLYVDELLRNSFREYIRTIDREVRMRY
jgi:hypothetical protein